MTGFDFLHFEFGITNDTKFMSATVFGTSGLFGNFPFARAMSGYDLFHFKFYAATYAKLMLATVYGTSGLFGNFPFACGMSERIDFFLFCRNAANGTNFVVSALFGTSRLNDVFPIAPFVAESRYLFIGRVVATRAEVVSVPADVGTISHSGAVMENIVSESVELFVDRIVTTLTSTVTVYAALFGTSGLNGVFMIVVSESGNGNCLGVDRAFARLVNEQTTAVGTFIMCDISVFGTSGSYLFHRHDVMNVSRQRNIAAFFLAATSTSSFFAAFFGFGRRFYCRPIAPFVAEFRNIRHVEFFAADGANEVLTSLLGTSGFDGYFPFARSVIDDCYLFRFELFVTYRTVNMLAALFGTRRLFLNFPIASRMRKFFYLFDLFLSAFADSVSAARFGAARIFGDYPFAECVPFCVKFFNFFFVATRANSVSAALFGTSRLNSDFPFTEVMTERFDLFRLRLLTANGTIFYSATLFKASRL